MSDSGLEALRAESRPGHCLCCDEPLQRGGPGRPRVVCDKPECRRAYKTAWEMGRVLSSPDTRALTLADNSERETDLSKRKVEEPEPVSVQAAPGVELPELWGYGIQKVGGGKYLAYLCSNQGGLKILTPIYHGKHVGEMKHSAVARVTNAFRIFVAAPEMAKRKGFAA